VFSKKLNLPTVTKDGKHKIYCIPRLPDTSQIGSQVSVLISGFMAASGLAAGLVLGGCLTGAVTGSQKILGIWASNASICVSFRCGESLISGGEVVVSSQQSDLMEEMHENLHKRPCRRLVAPARCCLSCGSHHVESLQHDVVRDCFCFQFLPSCLNNYSSFRLAFCQTCHELVTNTKAHPLISPRPLWFICWTSAPWTLDTTASGSRKSSFGTTSGTDGNSLKKRWCSVQ